MPVSSSYMRFGLFTVVLLGSLAARFVAHGAQRGRKEGKKELELSVRLDNERRAERQKQTETGTVPSPELLQDEP